MAMAIATSTSTSIITTRSITTTSMPGGRRRSLPIRTIGTTIPLTARACPIAIPPPASNTLASGGIPPRRRRISAALAEVRVPGRPVASGLRAQEQQDSDRPQGQEQPESGPPAGQGPRDSDRPQGQEQPDSGRLAG